MKHIVITLFMVAAFCFDAVASLQVSESLLKQLDAELEKQETYDAQKLQRIERLVKSANAEQTSQSRRALLYLQIADEYAEFMADSALVFFDRTIAVGEEIQDSTIIKYGNIGKIMLLGEQGFFNEGMRIIRHLEREQNSREVNTRLYMAAERLYARMGLFGGMNSKSHNTEHYVQRSATYREKLLELLDPATTLYRLYVTSEMVRNQEVARAKEELVTIMANLPENNRYFSLAARTLAYLLRQEGNDDEAAYYWLEAAISDIRTSTKISSALQNLAEYLYKNGDVPRANVYMTRALEDANCFNSILRAGEYARVVPSIQGAVLREQKRYEGSLIAIIVCVVMLVLVLMVLLAMILRQARQARQARVTLQEANSLKEDYIGLFLDLCSVSIERFEQLNKTALRKITAGQVEDLAKLLRSPRYVEQELQAFYGTFDSAFTHIYPSFVEDFNQLLKPEGRITCKDSHSLTPELRIYALLRLGFDDANKVAGFLHYSVNTVYTYRNRVKNLAINRDEFDKNVSNLCRIS